MSDWQSRLTRVEPLEDIPLDPDLVRTLEAAYGERFDAEGPPVDLYTPTFKTYQTSEIRSCGQNA
ncbi:MAG: radical SAM protein, partial [Ectothiorhodospira sp.]